MTTIRRVKIRKRPPPAVRAVPSTSRNAIDDSAELTLQALERALPMIARAVGPVCEFVLHDLRTDPPHIRAIANSHISGRKPGGPMGRIFVDGQELTAFDTPFFNYTGHTHDGKELRCSVIPCQHNGRTIGAICVNFLVNDLKVARDVISGLLMTEEHKAAISEFVPSQSYLFDDILESSLRERGRVPEMYTREDRLALLNELKARGALTVRGAVDRLAARLGISRTTIYNDLKELD